MVNCSESTFEPKINFRVLFSFIRFMCLNGNVSPEHRLYIVERNFKEWRMVQSYMEMQRLKALVGFRVQETKIRH